MSTYIDFFVKSGKLIERNDKLFGGMKRQTVFVWVIGGLVLAGCQSNVKKNSSNESLTRESFVMISETVVSTSESKVVDTAETKAIDIAGEAYTSSGDAATISNVSTNKWRIQYSTSDGKAEASFATNWQETQAGFTSETAMEKAEKQMGIQIL